MTLDACRFAGGLIRNLFLYRNLTDSVCRESVVMQVIEENLFFPRLNGAGFGVNQYIRAEQTRRKNRKELAGVELSLG